METPLPSCGARHLFPRRRMRNVNTLRRRPFLIQPPPHPAPFSREIITINYCCNMDIKWSAGFHLALLNFPPSLPVHDHPSKQTILCPICLMHAEESTVPFFFFFWHFTHRASHFFYFYYYGEEYQWKIRERLSLTFASAGRNKKHRLTWAAVCLLNTAPTRAGPRHPS